MQGREPLGCFTAPGQDERSPDGHVSETAGMARYTAISPWFRREGTCLRKKDSGGN